MNRAQGSTARRHWCDALQVVVLTVLLAAAIAPFASARQFDQSSTRSLLQAADPSAGEDGSAVTAEPQQSGETLPSGLMTTQLPTETVTVSFIVRGKLEICIKSFNIGSTLLPA